MFVKISAFITGLLLTCSVMASPQIENWQTDNGMRVYFVQASELPMLDIRLVFDAGAARDSKGEKPYSPIRYLIRALRIKIQTPLPPHLMMSGLNIHLSQNAIWLF